MISSLVLVQLVSRAAERRIDRTWLT